MSTTASTMTSPTVGPTTPTKPHRQPQARRAPDRRPGNVLATGSPPPMTDPDPPLAVPFNRRCLSRFLLLGDPDEDFPDPDLGTSSSRSPGPADPPRSCPPPLPTGACFRKTRGQTPGPRGARSPPVPIPLKDPTGMAIWCRAQLLQKTWHCLQKCRVVSAPRGRGDAHSTVGSGEWAGRARPVAAVAPPRPPPALM